MNRYGIDTSDAAGRAEYRRRYMADWRTANPGKLKGYTAARTKAYDPEVGRRNNYKNVFGVSPEVVSDMLDTQGGVCAICGRELEFPHKHTHLDHDHKRPHRLRGVLCHHCNVGLGHFKDRPNLLRSAATYLEMFQ